MNMKMFLLGVSIVVIVLGCVATITAQPSTIRDPWTHEAATFNPKGIRYSSGMTTGTEISNRQILVCADTIKQNLLAELNENK